MKMFGFLNAFKSKRESSDISVTINVTQEHIDQQEGRTDAVGKCMVAQALTAAGFTDVGVGFGIGHGTWKNKYYRLVFPPGVDDKVRDWVVRNPVEPFSFELPLREGR